MPELPDVEGFRQVARRHGRGEVVRSVRGQLAGMAGDSPQRMARSLEGCRLANPRRHGKWMIWPVDDQFIAFHFGMDGELVWVRNGEHERYDRVALGFDDGELRYRSRRKLGGVWVAANDDRLQEITGPLGPDALRASSRTFHEALAAGRGKIKTRLMDQEVLAGLGNLTADETLWRAGVDPRRDLMSLDDDERRQIEHAAKEVLRHGNAVGRVPDDNSSLTGQRDAETPLCPRCHGHLEKFTTGGRTTYACPRCQV